MPRSATMSNLPIRFDVQAAVTIALVSSLRVVEFYASRVLGTVATVALGPYVIFVQGLADETFAGLTCAVVLVLIPRVGVLALSLVTVFLLNGILVGSFGLSSLVFIAATVVFYEGAAAALGVTTTDLLRRPGIAAPTMAIVRVALALGIANAAKLVMQYVVFRWLFRLTIPDSFIVEVGLGPGLLYTSVGATIGTVLGFRLRRLAA